MEGIKDGRPQKITTGNRAERIVVDEADGLEEMREFVAGVAATVHTADAKRAIAAISQKLNEKLKPPDEE